jgi:2-polyprenyl-3-methyl-5-hydroxy-6-metoxy-1,4-benzoquinol methylase
MSAMAKLVMSKFYRNAAGDPARLPWHRENPSQLLVAAVEALGRRGRALDLGCGAGVFAAWMAEQGLQVTGIDLFPQAIAMARTRATARAVDVELVATNLADYQPAAPFDLVFDSGCLHSLVGVDVEHYKRKLCSWLKPEGHYVLGHWGKRHAFDWRPIGPTRRSEATITRLFAPEFVLLASEVEDFAVPLPMGPLVRGVGYHFRYGAVSSTGSSGGPN